MPGVDGLSYSGSVFLEGMAKDLLLSVLMFVKKPFEGLDSKASEEIIRSTVEDLRPSLLQDGMPTM